jgi:hypothetical protein
VAVGGGRTADAVVAAGYCPASPSIVAEPLGNAEGQVPEGDARVVLLAELLSVVGRHGLTVRVGRHELAQLHHGVSPSVEEPLGVSANPRLERLNVMTPFSY